MKKSSFSGLGFCVVAASLLSGCIDDSYDLSDIDTTTEIRVNNLVLPVNIDKLELKDVIKLNEEDKIKIVDGQYAVLVDGDFESDPIKIGEVNADAPHINSTSFPLGTPAQSGSGVTFAIPSHPESFNYDAYSIDESILSISNVTVTPMRIGLRLRFPDLAASARKITLKNVKIQFPAGIHGTPLQGTFDESTSVLTVPSLTRDISADDNGVDLYVTVNSIDLTNANSNFNTTARTFKFHGSIEITGGEISISNGDLNGSAPSSAHLALDYIFDSFSVKSFSGDMKYAIENFDIAPVELNDLPDFLAQDNTNIILGNPQIYISLINPLGEFNAYARTGLSLTANRPESPSLTFTPNNNEITIGHDKNNGPYAFCFSPEKPEKYYDGYAGADFEQFSTLGNVLSGKGLPQTIDIAAVNPEFPAQHVNNMRLGVELEPVKGSYTFFAPLDLKEGSNIVYTDTSDDWGSEDLDYLTIEQLQVSLNISTDINATVRLTGYPIDRDGNKINNVEVIGADIPANADNYPVTITTSGEIIGLDGFVYTVYAAPGQNNVQLKPDQHIILNNVRAKVSGKYSKEL